MFGATISVNTISKIDFKLNHSSIGIQNVMVFFKYMYQAEECVAESIN